MQLMRLRILQSQENIAKRILLFSLDTLLTQRMAAGRLPGMFVAAVLLVALSVLWYYQYMKSGVVYRVQIPPQNLTRSSTGVPKIIHFIWTNDEFPDELRLYVKSWIDMHPTWRVTLWSDTEILALIKAR